MDGLKQKVAAYCRVSTERQADEQTIDVQKQFLQQWADSNNATITKWYCDDGWSGDTLVRPELDNLRDEVASGIWDAVVFIDRDRLARTLAYQEYVIRELLEKAIKVIFLNNPLSEDPRTRIIEQVYGIVAEMERINIVERMRKGKIHKATCGYLVGHTAPYGYRYLRKIDEKNGYFEVYEPEAEIVRMIFHWVADEGYSMRQVVKELYKANIPSAKGNERWVKSSVERLLNRKDYIGISYYNRRQAVVPKNPQNTCKYKRNKKTSRIVRPEAEWISIKVPSIIDNELFAKTHQRLKDNILYGKRNKKYSYLLTGKVMCQCGAKRVGDGVNGHHYYRCAQRIYKFPLPNKCAYEGVNAEILDTMVWNKLVESFDNSDLIKRQAERWSSKQEKSSMVLQSDLESLKRGMCTLEGEEQKYVKAYTSGILDFEKFKEYMKDNKSKKEILKSQIQSRSDKNSDENVNLDSFDNVCDTLSHQLKYASISERQEYIKSLIISIYVGERSKATVNGRIPLVTDAQNIQDVLISRDSGVTQCWEKHAL